MKDKDRQYYIEKYRIGGGDYKYTVCYYIKFLWFKFKKNVYYTNMWKDSYYLEYDFIDEAKEQIDEILAGKVDVKGNKLKTDVEIIKYP